MDLYAILGVDASASTAEIKRAYRRLARRYHPDINPGDAVAECRFREIVRAYEVLTDPVRRRRYDAEGIVESEDRVEVTTFGFEGFDFSVEAVSGNRASTFGDLFAEVLRKPGPEVRDRPSRGSDLHAPVTIGFEESIRGVIRPVTITRSETCPTCDGRGSLPVADAVCVQCDGSGSVRSTRGHMIFTKPCPACGSSGRQREATCRRCDGKGSTPRSETVEARIPAGVADGERIRVPGKGNAGRFGGPAGDLVVSVTVEPHPLFRREGHDLHLELPVAVHEAALGARIEVPTPDGPARLRVPPGSQSGQRFRLRGRGVPGGRGGRGDLVATIRIVLPAVLDERSKELLREFGRINPESVREPVFEQEGGSRTR